MKPAHLRYYERYAPGAPFALLLAALLQRSRTRRLAALNRQRDYLALARHPERLALHHALNAELLATARSWDSYDYGEGYFYQGLAAIGVTGLRDTDSRVRAMELHERLAGRSVLEIGCNSGFLSLAVAPAAARVVGFDVNPHLVRIGRLAAEHLRAGNVELHASRFEDFETGETFDAVLSFANHHTYDRNTEQSIESYFARCARATAPAGLLLFESHPPQHEGDGLPGVRAAIARHYAIESERVLEHGTYLDAGRTFIVARKRSRG